VGSLSEKKFPVILQPTDGTSMKPTASASTDLVQAHKVFSGTPFTVTVRYWREMVRVARSGAHIVFDVMTENCPSPAVVEEWGRLGIFAVINDVADIGSTCSQDCRIGKLGAHRRVFAPMPTRSACPGRWPGD
jgi:hypothetical protein